MRDWRYSKNFLLTKMIRADDTLRAVFYMYQSLCMNIDYSGGLQRKRNEITDCHLQGGGLRYYIFRECYMKMNMEPRALKCQRSMLFGIHVFLCFQLHLWVFLCIWHCWFWENKGVWYWHRLLFCLYKPIDSDTIYAGLQQA